MTVRQILRCFIPAMALLLAWPAFAGVPFGSCSDPPFFADAALNVIVLPYYADVSSGADPLARRVAEELPLLLQSAALGSVMKYGGGIGSVGLVSTSRDADGTCTVRSVLAKIEPDMKTGQALILVWGTLFEEDGALELQTYVRFMRKGIVEGLSFVVGPETFRGEVSGQTIVFDPVRLSAQDLRDVHAAFQEASMLRSAPNPDSDGYPMYDFPDVRAFGYSVQEVRGDWLFVKGTAGMQGWVSTASGFGGRALAQRMPEADWIDGVAGYLRFRQGVEGGWPSPPDRVRTWVNEAFRKYAANAGDQGAAEPRAVADQLVGIVEYASPGSTLEDHNAALVRFQRSSERLPWSVGARTLAAFAGLQSAFAADSTAWRPADHERALLNALNLDPANRGLLSQLLNFYQLVDVNRPARAGSLHGTVYAEIPPERIRKQETQLEMTGLVAELLIPPGVSPVDLNSATGEELRERLGLTPYQVSAILYGRPFRGLDDPALSVALGEEGIQKLGPMATVQPRIEELKVRQYYAH